MKPGKLLNETCFKCNYRDDKAINSKIKFAVSICEKVKAHFKDDNSADSNTLDQTGSGNTLNTGGTGNTVNQPETPAENKKSSTHVATVSLMTTLTILGLNFL